MVNNKFCMDTSGCIYGTMEFPISLTLLEFIRNAVQCRENRYELIVSFRDNLLKFF